MAEYFISISYWTVTPKAIRIYDNGIHRNSQMTPEIMITICSGSIEYSGLLTNDVFIVDRAHDAGKQFRLNVLRQANLLPSR